MRLTIPGKARPYLMAHRGNQARCPENTLAAFRQAFADGIDILETDLRLSRDRAFVCIHDASVDRTTDGSGAVAAMSRAELKALSAGCGRAGFEGEKIPLLEELLAIFPAEPLLALELKTDDFLVPAVVMRLHRELSRFQLLGRTLVLSFSFERLQAVRQAVPELPTGWITGRRLWPRPQVELHGVFWPLLLVNPLYPLLAHRQGQALCPLDPDPDRLLPLYCLLGCDAVLSDNPAATRPRLERWRRLHALIHGGGGAD